MFNLVKSCRMFNRVGYCFKYNLYNPKKLNAFASEPTTTDKCLVNPYFNGTYHIDKNDPLFKTFNVYGNNKMYNNLETDCCGNGCKHCNFY